MASTAAGAQLSDAHRVAQARLSAQTVARLLLVWPLLGMDNLDATTERWLAAAVPIVEQAHGTSAALARQYLRLFATAETGAPSIASKLTIPVPVDRIRTSLIVQGPVAVKSAMAAGRPLASASSIASATSASAGSRQALSGGRDTVMEAAKADQRASGIVRVTSPGACDFCTQVAADSASNPSLQGHFQCHDNCHCQPEPVYG